MKLIGMLDSQQFTQQTVPDALPAQPCPRLAAFSAAA